MEVTQLINDEAPQLICVVCKIIYLSNNPTSIEVEVVLWSSWGLDILVGTEEEGEQELYKK